MIASAEGEKNETNLCECVCGKMKGLEKYGWTCAGHV